MIFKKTSTFFQIKNFNPIFFLSHLDFKYKFIFVIIFVTFSGIVSVMLASYLVLQNILTKEANMQLQYILKNKAKIIEEFYATTKNNLTFLSNNRYITDIYLDFYHSSFPDGKIVQQDTTYSEDHNSALKHNANNPEKFIKSHNFAGIAFATDFGQIIFSSIHGNNKKNTLNGKNLKNGYLDKSIFSKCFHQGLKNLYFTDSLYSDFLGRNISLLCMPINNPHSQNSIDTKTITTPGVIIAEIDVTFISNLLNDHWLMIQENSSIASKDLQRLLFSSSDKEKHTAIISSIAFINTLKKHSSAVFSLDIANSIYTVAYHSFTPIEGANWIIFSSVNNQSIYATLYKITKIASLVTLIILIIIAIAINYFGRFIIKPILTVSDLLYKRGMELEKLSQFLSIISTQLASAAAEQASSTTESVAAMNQMEAMIIQTNDFASSSQKMTKNVRDKTEEGNQIMSQLSCSMELIHQNNKQLQNISQIISDISKKTNVINEIVFNTKILSFNASIEAARAGQHGKGFAVVAEEVSRLATSSGNAAHEIKILLENSQKQVEEIVHNTSAIIGEGHEVASKALSIFQEIAGKINEINDHIRGIVQAGTEEIDGIRKTSIALHQLDRTSQDNSKLSSNTATYAHKLKNLNEKMSEATTILDSLVYGISSLKKHKKKRTIEIKRV
ncbi:MAG: hypothetical protein HQK52_16700 [Oligoflexia bacterium]|nr:hypothetical protein [Oligoflexia bacterium]